MNEHQKFSDYLTERLHDKNHAELFLAASIEDFLEDGDSESFAHCLRYIAEAQGGIGALAERTNLNRQNLYKALTGKTVPRFDTIMTIVHGLGYKFRLEPIVVHI